MVLEWKLHAWNKLWKYAKVHNIVMMYCTSLNGLFVQYFLPSSVFLYNLYQLITDNR